MDQFFASMFSTFHYTEGYRLCAYRRGRLIMTRGIRGGSLSFQNGNNDNGDVFAAQEGESRHSGMSILASARCDITNRRRYFHQNGGLELNCSWQSSAKQLITLCANSRGHSPTIT